MVSHFFLSIYAFVNAASRLWVLPDFCVCCGFLVSFVSQINSAVNPFVYGGHSKDFRAPYKRMGVPLC